MRPEQLLGGCVWELFPKAEGTKFYEGYHRAVATGQPVEFEEFYPEPLNIWLGVPLLSSAGGPSVYFHDITARKQAEATLRQNEGSFDPSRQAPTGVYVGRFADVAATGERIFAAPAFCAGAAADRPRFFEVMEISGDRKSRARCIAHLPEHAGDRRALYFARYFHNVR